MGGNALKKKYNSKYTSVSDDNIIRLLIPSLLGIAVCIICLFGTTWAWFTATVSVATATIQAADYDIDVVITDNELTSEDKTVSSDEGVYMLSTKTLGNGYTVRITAKGTASTGYCLINDEMATVQLKPGESIQFTLYPEEDNELYTFVSYWGTYAGDSVIDKNMTVGNPVISVEENSENTENMTEEDVEEEKEEPLEEESGEELVSEIKENAEESDLETESSEIEKNMMNDETKNPVLPEPDIEQTETE